MADDIQNLDSSPILRIPVNYQGDISGEMQYFRDVLQFMGTTQKLIYYSDSKYPRSYQIEFLFEKQEKYEFLEFWNNLKGEFSKFWYISEERSFELVSNIESSDTSFLAKSNNFEEVFKGNERVCFRFRNGDLLTRKIESITCDKINDECLLETGVSFDRNINLEDIFGIFYILPVRFEEEVCKIVNESKEVSTLQMRIKELLGEYPS